MGKILLGIVADDFSGASDAASFLVEQGIKTYLFNGIPEEKTFQADENIAIVIALKTRTERTDLAVQQSLDAFQWLIDNKASKLYSKYCSTFDSTREGNIGPIIDAVLDKYEIPYTIIAPALPINGRIVKDGHLIVNGIPLDETHMKDHPLTPMWDSDLKKLIEPQGKYRAIKINSDLLEDKENHEILKMINQIAKDNKNFYIIPDYANEVHAKRIVELFGDLKFLTGGSGLMTELGKKFKKEIQQTSDKVESSTKGKAIVLAGSCSQATLSQIDVFKQNNRKAIKLNPIDLVNGKQTKEEVWKEIEESDEDAILVYSSEKPENVKKAQEGAGAEKVSQLLEETTAHIALKAIENGYNRLIIAGGETSGAVTKVLGHDSYIIGESIAPGVPILVPLENKGLRLVLKSGNFGQEDFFLRAIELTKED